MAGLVPAMHVAIAQPGKDVDAQPPRLSAGSC